MSMQMHLLLIMTMPNDITVQTWIKLARAFGNAMSDIEQALQDNELPPLSWYDVLLELERVKGNGLRQFELENALLLKQYSVSRLVEKIEKDGCLQRVASKEDGRGKRLHITDKGRALRQKMWLIYGPKIENTVGQKLSQTQCQELGMLLGKLSNSPS